MTGFGKLVSVRDEVKGWEHAGFWEPVDPRGERGGFLGSGLGREPDLGMQAPATFHTNFEPWAEQKHFA